jgi:hypothetical protein
MNFGDGVRYIFDSTTVLDVGKDMQHIFPYIQNSGASISFPTSKTVVLLICLYPMLGPRGVMLHLTVFRFINHRQSLPAKLPKSQFYP